MDTTGRHLLVEYHGCDTAVLNDKSRIESILKRAAKAAKATVVGAIFRNFTPQGVTGVVVVEESHLSIHTWPEYGYAAVDFYTCGECTPERAHELLLRELGASTSEVLALQRGLRPDLPSIRELRHTVERTGERVEAPAGSGRC